MVYGQLQNDSEECCLNEGPLRATKFNLKMKNCGEYVSPHCYLRQKNYCQAKREKGLWGLFCLFY